MENLFDAFILCCLCVGMAVMIVRFAKQKSFHITLDRFIVITFGVGFVLGAIGKAVIAPVEWTFALYVVGAYLSYTAAILSFPQFGEKNEVSENE